MNKLLIGFGILLGQAMAQQTIIIHLDVNGTIMAEDLVQGKTGEATITQEFAKKAVGIWRSDLPEMRYQDYVEQHLIQGAEADQSIKKQRRELYSNFLSMLKSENHSDLENIQTRYDDLIAILRSQQDPLYASFWNLVDWAKASPHDVRFVFRTFGQDIPSVAKLLSDKGHPVNNIFGYEGGQLYRGHFQDYTFIKGAPVHDLSETFSAPFNAIRDDWKLWNTHGETEPYAKPFHYVAGMISIFFDDNAKEKQIIAPKGFLALNGTALSTHDLIESGHVVAVNPLKAMTQPDYFVKKN